MKHNNFFATLKNRTFQQLSTVALFLLFVFILFSNIHFNNSNQNKSKSNKNLFFSDANYLLLKSKFISDCSHLDKETIWIKTKFYPDVRSPNFCCGILGNKSGGHFKTNILKIMQLVCFKK